MSVRPDESCSTRELEKALVAVEETPSLWIRREHGARFACDILNKLVANGKLSLSDVQAAAAEADIDLT